MKSIVKLLKNNLGVGILEVTIAAGMLGGIAVGIMKIMDQTISVQKSSEGTLEATTSQTAIMSILNDTTACTMSMNDTIPAKMPVPASGVAVEIATVYNKSGDKFYIKGSDDNLTNLTVKEMYYKPLDDYIGPAQATLNFSVIFERKTGSGGLKTINRNFSIAATIDSSNLITSCSSYGDDSTAFNCSSFGSEVAESDPDKCAGLNLGETSSMFDTSIGAGMGANLLGNRLIWSPTKGAVLFGNGEDTAWQLANQGVYSLAGGNQSWASGENAIALGFQASATGVNSIAIGPQAYAYGDNTYAIGSLSSSEGLNTIAIGTEAYGFGENSIALFGGILSERNFYGIYSPKYSFVMGTGSELSGEHSFNFGEGNDLLGNHSMVFGQTNTVKSKWSGALGKSNIVSGFYSLATGQLNTVVASHSLAVGQSNTIFASHSLATGQLNTVIAQYSMVSGISNIMYASKSLAIGSLNTVGTASFPLKQHSFAVGTRNKVEAAEAYAFGAQNQISKNQASAFGTLNILDENFTYAFGNANKIDGAGSVAIGSLNSVGGISSIAMGTLNKIESTTSFSFAVGNANTVQGPTSIAMGTENLIKSDLEYGFAVGKGNIVEKGDYGVALGYNNIVSRNIAEDSEGGWGLAIGNGNSALRMNSVAIGKNNLANNKAAVAIGRKNTASGFQSMVAGGMNNIASGNQSFATGFMNQSTGDQTFVIGRENSASGSRSVAIGYKATATGDYSLALNLSGPATGKTLKVTGNNSIGINLGDSSFTVSGDNRFVIKGADVGIGGSATPSYKLKVHGKINATVDIVNDSDRRLKANIKNFRSMSKIIKRMKPVEYFWKDKRSTEKNFGFIAQDIMKIFPNLVSLDNDSQTYSLNYIGLIAPLTKAVQEQQEIIEKQSSKISSLEARLLRLEQYLEQKE